MESLMAAIPYMPLYVSDYLADAGHLSTFEHGAYLLLIMNYWQRGGPLPNDEKQLARIARVTMPQWRKIAPTITRFFVSQGDFFVHQRIDRELSRVLAKSLKAREAGLASVERRLSGRSAEPQQTFNHTDTDTIEDTSVSSPPLSPVKIQAGFTLPDWVPEAEWIGFCEMRRRIRAPLTDRAKGAIIRQLEQLHARGHPPGRVLDQSTANAWRGVFELKDGTNDRNMGRSVEGGQFGGGAARPSGRLGAVLELLAEVREANAN
jgi:uncharacterized protein YdaU (DUF1376 family)